MFLRAAALCLALASSAFGQSIGVEPGQSESKSTTQAVAPTTQWTHPPIEARGVWLTSHSLLGPREDLLKKLDQLQAANFNTVLIDTWFRGCVAYPKSEIVPQYPDFAAKTSSSW